MTVVAGVMIKALYDYYKGPNASGEFPETLEAMSPLYAAVAHGCRAGRYQEALDEVFIKRIRRQDMHFSLFQLGAIGSDLAALSNFFDKPFDEPVRAIDAWARAYVLNEVGSAFRILGHLQEAVRLIKRSRDIYSSKPEWRLRAARAGRNLSKTYMQMGRLNEAIEYASEALELVSKRAGEMGRYISHANLARALHLSGAVNEAREHFKLAETVRAAMERDRFTLQEAHYCDLLIEQNQSDTALTLLNETLNPSLEELGPLDYGLYCFSRGKALFNREDEDAEGYLDEAIDSLKKVMRQDELGFAHLARAGLHREREAFDRAAEDLEEAQKIVQRSGIEILRADCHLEACRLHLARAQLEEAEKALNAAQTLVKQISYRRRTEEVEALSKLLHE